MFLESEDAAPVGVKLNPLSYFVYLRTYARWIEEDGARETEWGQTVRRYLKWLTGRRTLPSDVVEEIESLMLQMDVLPSMRALWASGEAADRDNTTCYNCSFAVVDNIRVFAEALHILMSGTGFGFSVERQFVSRLPEVQPARLGERVVVVEDSTEGWADALYELLVALWKGYNVSYDTSKVRRRGSILKIKGGRASGPEPLEGLFDVCIKILTEARGRQLRPIEAHDIMCLIGEIVRVGGFRRAALISFSDPDDEEMRHAKDWSLGQFPEWRYMSNNSAYYETRPSRDVFDREWAALVKSGAGERGFSIGNWIRRARRNGIVRSNPCVTGDTRVMTAEGLVPISDLVGRRTGLIVDGRFGRGSVGSTTDKGSWITATKQVFRLETEEGYSVRLTADHRVMTARGWVEAQNLVAGDHVHITNNGGGFGTKGSADAGMLAGWLVGDGTLVDQGVPRLYFYDNDREIVPLMLDAAERLTGTRPNRCEYLPARRESFESADLRQFMGEIVEDKFSVPEFVWRGTQATQRAFLSALFTADGHVSGSPEKGHYIRLGSVRRDLLCAVQQVLLNFGIASRIYDERMPAGVRMLPDGNGGLAPYDCQKSYDLNISKANMVRFHDLIGFLRSDKNEKLAAIVASYTKGPYSEKFTARLKTLVPEGEEVVYDLTEPTTHSFVANGIVVHNCHEIGLRARLANDPWTGEGGGGQFCNLSAAVMRSWDTLETMTAKVRAATWIGATQASFTHFPYLRPGWAELCEEDRLLGVDITGQCDNPALAHNPKVMLELNRVAREEAAKAAAWLGINHPAAITCGKPSGNTSQLVDCASGFHARYSPYYIRRVRTDAKDPLTKLLRDHGVPMKKEVGKQHLSDDECPIWVVEFPVAAPKGAMLRDAETAIQMLERYLMIMRTWCGSLGHNQSITVYVKDHEWDEVGQWVWDHFDEVTGVSFLPHSNHKYELAPYEEIDEATYLDLLSKFPEIDYSLLRHYEATDMGQGASELACTSGNCEI